MPLSELYKYTENIKNIENEYEINEVLIGAEEAIAGGSNIEREIRLAKRMIDLIK